MSNVPTGLRPSYPSYPQARDRNVDRSAMRAEHHYGRRLLGLPMPWFLALFAGFAVLLYFVLRVG